MRWRLVILVGLFFVGLSSSRLASAQSSLPRLSIEQLRYDGAFRLSAETFGISSLNYAQGPIEYNANNHSLFVVGHSHQQAIAEFAVPELVMGSDVAQLNMATAPAQTFASVLGRTPSGNTQQIDRIGGMELFDSGDASVLLVNGYEYYDAPGDNTHTTLLLTNSADLASTNLRGYFELAGGAGHTSGWMSPIPAEWQAALGGTHLAGQSSGIPIIGRTSVGPSAFAFDAADVVASADATQPITTDLLLDFTLANPLHSDLSNSTSDNDLWTHLSRATFGMIVPGTRTYLTVGYSGGHASGVCYKCTQDNGELCGGYCAPQADDYYTYYWLWDVNDLLAVATGSVAAHSVRPYDYGELTLPFAATEIGGGSFDPNTGQLYLTAMKADREQGQYNNPPIVVVYSLQTTPSSVQMTETLFVEQSTIEIWGIVTSLLMLCVASTAQCKYARSKMLMPPQQAG